MKRDCCRKKYDDSDLCERDDDNQTAVLTRRSTKIEKCVDGSLVVSYRAGRGRKEAPLCKFRKIPIERAYYLMKGLADQLWKELHKDDGKCPECPGKDCHCDDDSNDGGNDGSSGCIEYWEGPESGVLLPSYPSKR